MRVDQARNERGARQQYAFGGLGREFLARRHLEDPAVLDQHGASLARLLASRPDAIGNQKKNARRAHLRTVCSSGTNTRSLSCTRFVNQRLIPPAS